MGLLGNRKKKENEEMLNDVSYIQERNTFAELGSSMTSCWPPADMDGHIWLIVPPIWNQPIWMAFLP